MPDPTQPIVQNQFTGGGADIMSGLGQISNLAQQGTYQNPLQTASQNILSNLGGMFIGPAYGPNAAANAGSTQRVGTPGTGVNQGPVGMPGGADWTQGGQFGLFPYQSPETAALFALNQLPTYIGGPQTGPNTPEMMALSSMANINNMGPIGSSPWTKQAISQLESQFQTQTLPQIQNQMALAGLGNSTALGDEIQRARSSIDAQVSQLLQNEMNQRLQTANPLLSLGQTLAGRPLAQAQTLMSGTSQMANIGAQQAEREMQNRQLQSQLGVQGAQIMGNLGAQVAGQEQLPFTRFMQAVGSVVPSLMQMGVTQTQDRNNLISQLEGMGVIERGIAQQMSDAQINELARQQGIATSSIWGPFESIMPRTIGQQTNTTSGGFGFGK